MWKYIKTFINFVLGVLPIFAFILVMQYENSLDTLEFFLIPTAIGGLIPILLKQLSPKLNFKIISLIGIFNILFILLMSFNMPSIGLSFVLFSASIFGIFFIIPFGIVYFLSAYSCCKK